MSTPQSETKSSTPIEDKELSIDDAIKFMGEDHEPEIEDSKQDKKADKEDKEYTSDKADEKEDEDKDKEDEEDEELSPEDELKAIEEELEEAEEPDEEKLELLTPPRRQEILKVFPDLFKKFPYMEKAYYREQQFTRIFPDINEAKSAKEAVETLQNFENDIVGEGNFGNALKLIKENNPDKYLEVVDNYMITLEKLDQNSYNHVLSNVARTIIGSMLDDAKENDDKNMGIAAAILNKFLFGTTKYKAPSKLAKEDVSPTKKDEKPAEDSYAKVALNNTVDQVSGRVDKIIKSNLEANIDPRGSMSEYIKKNAIRDATEKINSLIERDSRFKQLTDRLWNEAVKAKFSKTSVDKIVRAFEAKSKSLLAPVIKSARNEALKGSQRRIKDNDEQETDKPTRERVRESERRSSSKPDKTKIPVGMSTFDYLNSD